MRQCCCCGAPIENCMGCVHSSDLVKAFDGKIAWSEVREHCGPCDILSLALDNGVPFTEGVGA
jgi:hypothetical protein